MNLNVQTKKEDDNIKEFQDLFAMGKGMKISKDLASLKSSKKVDLTYNPGQIKRPEAQLAPAQAAQPMMAPPAHIAPVEEDKQEAELSLFGGAMPAGLIN